jgi:hypothetical protein
MPVLLRLRAGAMLAATCLQRCTSRLGPCPGLRNGGGIGDVLRPRSKTEPLFAARVIYDLAFYFFVIIIVLNLIFGVIIDTFADLRAEKNEKEVGARLQRYGPIWKPRPLGSRK